MTKKRLIRWVIVLVLVPVLYIHLLKDGTIAFFSQLPSAFAAEPFPPKVSLGLDNELPCVPMNDEERLQESDVLKILQDFPGSAMYFDAINFFAYAQYREFMDVAPGQEPAPPGQNHIVCRDNNIDAAIASTLLQQGVFSGNPFLSPDEIHLASMLGPRDPRIVTAVAANAFGPGSVHVGSVDTRALARLVLAQYGPLAAPWSEQALSAMSTTDAAGTAAARVAIAANNPMALPRAAQLISNILADNPYGVISTENADRITELANAMAISGPKARPYIAPLIEASKRRFRVWFCDDVDCWSSPPIVLCKPLSIIGGDAAKQVLQQPWCTNRNA